MMGASVTISPRDKMQAALDRLFGLAKPDPMRARDEEERLRLLGVHRAYESCVPPFNSLPQAYEAFGGDDSRFGSFQKGRVTEEINSGTFPLALGNTLGRLLASDYGMPDYGEELIIGSRKRSDLRQQRAAIVGYFGDLSDVDPEMADYLDPAPPGEVGAPYAVGQKGNILTLTRRAFLNDDIGLFRRLVGRMGRAARRTHARYCWAPFINNVLLYDGVAFFDGAHANLGAAVLGLSNVQAAIAAIRSQTELNSGERIPFAGPFHLWVPLQLEFAADQVAVQCAPLVERVRPSYPSAPVGKVVPHVNALFTDTNDWVLTVPPTDCELLEMAYVNGNEEPEVVFAGQTPSEGVMFRSEKLQYKIRHEYGGVIVDYRGAYKSQVAG
jgi:hypothetical protein